MTFLPLKIFSKAATQSNSSEFQTSRCGWLVFGIMVTLGHILFAVKLCRSRVIDGDVNMPEMMFIQQIFV